MAPKPTKECLSKLKKELKAYANAPAPYVPLVQVNERNILEWHYLIEGPPDSPYAGGWYVGLLKFPHDYPFKPPGIMMLTPNGRFKTGERLCLSISDFHPESWNPMWSVASVVTGILSFMLEDTNTTGAISTTLEEKRKFAAESVEYNRTAARLKNIFPEKMAEVAAAAAAAAAAAEAAGDEGAAGGAAGGGLADAPVELDEEGVRVLEAAEEEMRAAEPDAALSRLTRALDRAGPSAPAPLYLARARAHVACGDIDAAIALLQPLETARAGRPAPPGAAAIAAMLMSSKLKVWREAGASKAEGNDAFRRGDFAAAAGAYERSLAREPGCSAVHCNRAAALSGLGRHAEAAEAAGRALAIHGGYAKARRRRADALLAAGAHGEAASLYVELAKMSPGDEGIQRGLEECRGK